MKVTHFVALTISPLLLVFSAGANAKPYSDRMVAACTALNHDYALARDHADQAAFVALFSEEAVFTMQGETYSGREKILERLKPGASANFARLLINTIKVTQTSDYTATGVTYFTMFMASEGNEPELPVNDFILFMGEYHDEYIMTDDGCKITKRKTVPMFSGALKQ